MTILKAMPGNPCSGMKCDMPEADLKLYGIGTIAACSRCGRQASLDFDRQLEGGGAIWVWLLGEDYVDVSEEANDDNSD